MTSIFTWSRTQRGIIMLSSTLIVLCGLAAAYLLNTPPPHPRPTIDDISSRPLACLIYDPPAHGDISNPEPAVWSTMQQAAAAAPLNIQQMEIPTRHGNPQPFLSALIARHCDLIVAIGPSLAKAATAAVRQSPTQSFLLADSSTVPHEPYIHTVVGTTPVICAAVTGQLTHLAR
jgi:basic membrane lipoprotein Med (substrate-binding protein (PBP1-ABC) superfamily)